jgi:hypothetical protein
MFFLEIDLA